MNIKGSEKLVEVFGCWPSFHDAEVQRFCFDTNGTECSDGPVAEFTIHLWEMTKEIDEKGHFVLKNHVLVTLRFSGVSTSEFIGFNQQNVLRDLEIEDVSSHPLEEAKYVVDLPSSYGLSGSLRCFDIEVMRVVRCDAEGQPLAVE